MKRVLIPLLCLSTAYAQDHTYLINTDATFSYTGHLTSDFVYYTDDYTAGQHTNQTLEPTGTSFTGTAFISSVPRFDIGPGVYFSQGYGSIKLGTYTESWSFTVPALHDGGGYCLITDGPTVYQGQTYQDSINFEASALDLYAFSEVFRLSVSDATDHAISGGVNANGQYMDVSSGPWDTSNVYYDYENDFGSGDNGWMLQGAVDSVAPFRATFAPEPQPFVALGLGGLVLFGLRRRGSRSG